MPMMRALPVALLMLMLGVSVTGCGGAASGQTSSHPDGRMVLISGRDDHGLVARERVPLYSGPASTKRVGAIPDGTLAHVRQTDGSWLHVVTAEGRRVDGWVDDFFLRGVAHLVGPAPSCRAWVAGRLVAAGPQVIIHDLQDGQVFVSGVADPAMRGWAPRQEVQELAPQPPRCNEDPPGPAHPSSAHHSSH